MCWTHGGIRERSSKEAKLAARAKEGGSEWTRWYKFNASLEFGRHSHPVTPPTPLGMLMVLFAEPSRVELIFYRIVKVVRFSLDTIHSNNDHYIFIEPVRTVFL